MEIENILNRFKNSIENSGLSYTELENRTGVAKSSIQRYVVGDTKKIPFDAIIKISNAINVDPKYIFGWEEQVHIKSEPKIDATTQQAIDLYTQLDIEDRAEIRGEMKNMLKAEKYSVKDALSSKKMA